MKTQQSVPEAEVPSSSVEAILVTEDHSGSVRLIDETQSTTSPPTAQPSSSRTSSDPLPPPHQQNEGTSMLSMLYGADDEEGEDEEVFLFVDTESSVDPQSAFDDLQVLAPSPPSPKEPKEEEGKDENELVPKSTKSPSFLKIKPITSIQEEKSKVEEGIVTDIGSLLSSSSSGMGITSPKADGEALVARTPTTLVSSSSRQSLSSPTPRRRRRSTSQAVLDFSDTPRILEVEHEDDLEESPQEEEEFDEEAEAAKVKRLVDFLRIILHPNELPVDGVSWIIQKRVQFFMIAQGERRRRYEFKPYGIVGLYTNLSDIRADLDWACAATLRQQKCLPYFSWHETERLRQSGQLRRPWFTFAILLVSVVAMILAFHINDWKIELLQDNPLAGPTSQVLLDMGALQTKLVVENGEYYRLFSSIFLHAGLIHLGVNLIAIWLLSGCVEDNHGFKRTAIIFFFSAISGNLWSAVMQPGYILVGASGGIFGLFGALIADCILNWKILFHVFQSRAPRNKCVYVFITSATLFMDVFLNSLIGFTPYVDNFAHMGGMVHGFLVGLLVLPRLPVSFFGRGSSPCYKTRIFAYRSAGGIFACMLCLIASLLLWNSDGVTSPCFECRYISCLPFPFWKENKWWYCDGCDAVSGEVFYLGDQTEVFNRLELYCPQGGTLFLDISSYGFTETSEVHRKMPSFCREYC